MKHRLCVLRKDARDSGSCNFCNQLPTVVTVIASNADFCTLSVRICDLCLEDLKVQT
jgi:hypothetical protein